VVTGLRIVFDLRHVSEGPFQGWNLQIEGFRGEILALPGPEDDLRPDREVNPGVLRPNTCIQR
jgi:hypothetical protein